MNLYSDLDIFESLDRYRRSFMDPILWSPFVKRVLQDQLSIQVKQVVPGFSGTYPTFLVNEKWVVKFFGRLFEGGQSWSVETAAARLLQEHPVLPVPAFLAQGELCPGEAWHWPYLIFEFVPGVRIAEALPRLTPEARNEFAFWLGERIRALHQIKPSESIVKTLPDQRFLLLQTQEACMKNHLAWGSLPEYLILQIPSFLKDTEDQGSLVPFGFFIHADLTGDHVLGEIEAGTWQTRAVIDFGDAMIGNLDYELVALHLDLFKSDKQMLSSFLAGYDLSAASLARLPWWAMRAALLHQFNVFAAIPEAFLRQRKWKNLEELALAIWEI